MRFRVVPQTRLAVSCLGLLLGAAIPLGAQDPPQGSDNPAVAESVIAREEAASARAFDPAFRAKAKDLLAALPLAELVSETGEDGLGLNSLGDSQADLVYTPVTPCRIVDTRLAGGILAANTTRSFLVTGMNYSAQGGSATGCGVPYGPTTAAVVNFVAVTPAGQGSLWVTPFGTPMPNASIINYTAGVNIANGLSVAICNPSTATCTQDITIRANNSAAHLVADVQGYFRKTPALFVNTPLGNTAVGDGAFEANTTGTNNTATGAGALASNSTGQANTATGAGALRFSATGNDNSAFGNAALQNNTSGGNSAFGSTALRSNTTGGANSAFGSAALQSNTTASYNSAFGSAALQANTTGFPNAAFGFGALGANTTGSNNAAFGYLALSSNPTGSNNAAFGQYALFQPFSGTNNIAVGYGAGTALTSGSHNIYIGNSGLSSESNTIRIGDADQTATYITGTYSAIATARAVFVNSDGKLGTMTSSRRYKEQIADMDAESDVLLKLRPVSFYYRPELDETHLRQYGLVAEEVAEVAPGLVAYDKDGAPQTVRYHFVNAMLLNEVQEQRRLVEDQRRQLEAQHAEIRDLRAQESKILDLEARLAKLEAARGDQ